MSRFRRILKTWLFSITDHVHWCVWKLGFNTRFSGYLIGAAAVIIAACAFGPAHSAVVGPLPSASFEEYINYFQGGFKGITQYGPGTLQYNDASVTDLGQPTATVFADSLNSLNATVSGYITYYGYISSPVSYNIPVDVTYSSFVSVENKYIHTNECCGGSAFIEVYQGNPNNFLARMQNIYFDIGTQVDNGTITADVTTNSLFEIYLGASASSGSESFIDPFIQIDPLFLADNPGISGTLTLYTSSDVGNYVSSAPEPSAWALMIAGIGGIGVALRRSRKTRPPPATLPA